MFGFIGKAIFWLRGKKVYILGTAGILTATVALADGKMSMLDYIRTVMEALTAMGIRAGISKMGSVQ